MGVRRSTPQLKELEQVGWGGVALEWALDLFLGGLEMTAACVGLCRMCVHRLTWLNDAGAAWCFCCRSWSSTRS